MNELIASGKTAYFETVKRDLTQGDQPRLFARHQHLVEIKRQAEVPKRRRIVRAQANRDSVVQHRRDWVHRYRGGITLGSGMIETIKIVSVRLNDGERSYQNFVPISV